MSRIDVSTNRPEGVLVYWGTVVVLSKGELGHAIMRAKFAKQQYMLRGDEEEKDLKKLRETNPHSPVWVIFQPGSAEKSCNAGKTWKNDPSTQTGKCCPAMDSFPKGLTSYGYFDDPIEALEHVKALGLSDFEKEFRAAQKKNAKKRK